MQDLSEIVGFAWIHNKTGNVYSAVGTATDATNDATGRIMVIYHRPGQHDFFVREVSEFRDKFRPMA